MAQGGGSVVFLVWLGAVLASTAMAFGGALKAPEGLFKDLNDEIVGEAIIIDGRQLFIDDYIVEDLKGAEKLLNQPVKHPRNPLIVHDKPWEKGSEGGQISVIYDEEERIFKMWYGIWLADAKPSQEFLYYATSEDGINWQKPTINAKEGNNIVFAPQIPGFQSAGIFKDRAETDPGRRYKMLFSACQDGTSKTWSTNAAYSPDGIHWTGEPENPLIPFSDVQACPFRDDRLGRYAAILRYGPPNTRLIARIESEDFVHWSPKVTILRLTKMDEPFATCLYGMRIMPYEGVYIGLLTTYHGETIKPIPKDKEGWMDKVNVQLAFSRNGLTWSRVGKHGAIPHRELSKERDWKAVAQQATFIPYGEHGKDWDWGMVYAGQGPLIVGDEIRIYYRGQTGRHWWNYHGDKPTFGIGLATLRLDGFVSIHTEQEGTMTTKTFVFIGDSLEVNANATGGSITVEALDAEGKIIEGFSKDDCEPITTDSVRHVVKWKDSDDCHLIQARPIKLRFYLKKAKLYSFTPRIRHKHYVPSYD